MMELSPAVCRVVSAMNPRPMQTRGSSVPSQRSGRQKTNCTNLNITQNGASAPDAVQRRAVPSNAMLLWLDLTVGDHVGRQRLIVGGKASYRAWGHINRMLF